MIFISNFIINQTVGLVALSLTYTILQHVSLNEIRAACVLYERFFNIEKVKGACESSQASLKFFG